MGVVTPSHQHLHHVEDPSPQSQIGSTSATVDSREQDEMRPRNPIQEVVEVAVEEVEPRVSPQKTELDWRNFFGDAPEFGAA
ncbi:hypothetical protein HK097_008580 [Rhizophlyctis rosea]|uniref:Uncharacterized protein n=1 Tax=Rhizophlyctis rosea TaxID=64517 RepID=A0AAD5X996_9FUNG|nr:hypothetical protein HK097_008580 [Rhizophlyctis rosea]